MCMTCITFDRFPLSMFQVPPEPQHEWYCAVCMTIVWMDHILLIHLAGAVQLSQERCCKHPWSVFLVLLGVHVRLGWLSHRISPWLTVWESARVSLKSGCPISHFPKWYLRVPPPHSLTNVTFRSPDSIATKCLDLQLVAYDIKQDLQLLLISCIWRNECSNPPLSSQNLVCSWVVCLRMYSRH